MKKIVFTNTEFPALKLVVETFLRIIILGAEITCKRSIFERCDQHSVCEKKMDKS